MLKAIIHGKAGRFDHIQDETISWSKLFKTREDLLTATIFERFSYLSDQVQHQILMQWFCNAFGILPESFGEFVDITYWKRFNHNHDRVSNQVEPDVIVNFKKCNIIVEVKSPSGGQQYFLQWKKEIESFFQDEENDNSKSIYFLAIGGVDKSYIPKWSEQLLQLEIRQIKAIAALNWDAVTAQLVELISEDAQIGLSRQDNQIIHDMLEGLGLYGQKTSPFKWIQLTNSNLGELSLYSFKINLKQKIITLNKQHLSFENLLQNTLPTLDIQYFQSAIKELK